MGDEGETGLEKNWGNVNKKHQISLTEMGENFKMASSPQLLRAHKKGQRLSFPSISYKYLTNLKYKINSFSHIQPTVKSQVNRISRQR